MDSMYKLVVCVVDAVGRHPKPDWRQSLVDACDAVEAEYDAMKEQLSEVKDEQEA
tara:strand:+ start:914 stop:1078 length:165 start_codon:yes stop_codon:yes gene_type:complete